MKNINSYLKIELHQATLLFFFLLFIWLNYEEQWLLLFDKHILPYLKISQKNLFICIFIITTIGMIKKLINTYKRKYTITLNQLSLTIFIILIYIKYRFFSTYIQEPYTLNIKYIDIFTFGLFIFCIICVINLIKNNSKDSNNEDTILSIISDNPIKSHKEDILNYTIVAQKVAQDLEKLKTNQSWSIGITSPWGTGKSSFINLIEEFVNKNKFIVIKFNPRASKNIQNIQEDFFSILYSNLRPYNSNFSQIFKKYMESLQIIENSSIISTLLNIKNISDKDHEKEKLEKALKQLPKQIIIIIEDFDRLTAEEIIEIFKLIDNNASFPKIIFLTAYDKKHTAKILKETHYNEETPFADKFFNIEITVPIRPYQKIFDYLSNTLLQKIDIKEEENERYKIILSNNYNILKKYISTLRDSKRFINLFVNDFSPIKEEVNFEDFLLSTIIKYKDPYEHKKLYEEKYTTSISEFIILKNKIDCIYIDILQLLFKNKPESYKKQFRRIYDKKSFNNYFINYIYNQLSISTMKETLKQRNINNINNWIEEKTINDFIEYLSTVNIKSIKNEIEFYNFIYIVFYLSESQYDTIIYLLILELINKENIDIFKRFCTSEQKYKTYLFQILKSQYPNYKHKTTRKILINILDKEIKFKTILSEKELLEINREYLNNFISITSNMEGLHIDLLYSCIECINPETHFITLEKKSCLSIKELIQKDPIFYINNFVRLGGFPSNPEINSITCEPFWKQIFESSESFENFIKNQKLDNIDKITRVRNFWALYCNNNYQPIHFELQGNVISMINNDLIEQKEKLDELLNIETEFNDQKNKFTSKKDNQVEYFYQNLINRIENLKLNIYKTETLQNDIKIWFNNLSNDNPNINPFI